MLYRGVVGACFLSVLLWSPGCLGDYAQDGIFMKQNETHEEWHWWDVFRPMSKTTVSKQVLTTEEEEYTTYAKKSPSSPPEGQRWWERRPTHNDRRETITTSQPWWKSRTSTRHQPRTTTTTTTTTTTSPTTKQFIWWERPRNPHRMPMTTATAMPTTKSRRWWNRSTTKRESRYYVLPTRFPNSYRHSLQIVSSYCAEECRITNPSRYHISEYLPKCSCRFCYSYPSDIAAKVSSNIKAMLLSRNEISSIPRQRSMESLRFLDISWNDIKRLENYNFEYSRNLKTLNISHNVISSVDWYAFQGLTHLKVLMLSFNQLENIDTIVFSPIRGILEILDLGHNKFTELDFIATSSLSSLDELFLNNNHLTEINKGSFIGLSNLRRLHLQSNMIINIEAESFRQLIRLEYLDLSHNDLTSFDWNTWFGLQNLNHLNVIGNKVPSLTYQSFAGNLAHSLRSLSIGGRALTSVTRKSFPRNLTSLTISDSSIKRINEGTFAELHHLVHLNIVNNPFLYEIDRDVYSEHNENRPSIFNASFNVLEHIQYKVIQGHGDGYSRNQTYFYGEGNNWICDDELYWLTYSYSAFSIQNFDVHCSSPRHLRGRTAAYLDYQEFHPKWYNKVQDWFIILYEQHKYWVIVGGIGAGLALLILTMCCALCCTCCCRCCCSKPCCRKKARVPRPSSHYRRLMETPVPQSSLETRKPVERPQSPQGHVVCDQSAAAPLITNEHVMATAGGFPEEQQLQQSASETVQPAPSNEFTARPSQVVYIPEEEILQVFP